MRIKRRWMRWVFEEADALQVTLPWERGADRRAWRRHLPDSITAALPRRA